MLVLSFCLGTIFLVLCMISYRVYNLTPCEIAQRAFKCRLCAQDRRDRGLYS